MSEQTQKDAKKSHGTPDKMAGFITVLMFSAIAVTVFSISITLIVACTTAEPDSNTLSEALTKSLQLLMLGLVSFSVLVAAKILYMSYKLREMGNVYLHRILASSWDQEQIARNMGEQEQICDKIKELAFRSKNIDVLKSSIDEMLERHDFKGAEAAIEAAKTMGVLGNDAEKFKKNVEKSKEASLEERIEKQSKRVHMLIDKRDWVKASQETRALESEYPDHPTIKPLANAIKSARSKYKAFLLKQYGDAVKVDNIDKSYELLKELDMYLTPQEGEALKESARDVFKKRLHNLGVQFSIATASSQWQTAIETGQEIMREYPNSQMGREVKEKMPRMQQKLAAKEGHLLVPEDELDNDDISPVAVPKPVSVPTNTEEPQPVSPQPVPVKPTEEAGDKE